MIKLIKVPVVSETVRRVEEIVTKNKTENRKTVVFCDDCLVVELERSICRIYGGGLFEPFVYTFSAFLKSYGSDKRKVLSPQGSAMIMKRIIERNRDADELSCFNTAEVAADVYDAVTLLYSHCADVASLKEHDFSDGFLNAKIRGICFVYEKYCEYLHANELLDTNTDYDRLPSVIAGSKVLDGGADVVFAGYSYFSYTEEKAVAACMDAADSVYGILVGGRGEGDSLRPVYTDEAIDVFTACAKLCGKYIEIEAKKRAALSSPEAEKIISGIFNGYTFAGDSLESERIHLFEAVNTEEELEYTAAKIKQIVWTKDARYKDVAVMMSDVDSCRPLISRVFSDYGIPFYIDGKLPLTDCPVCAFLTDIVSCNLENYPPDLVDAVVSNPLFSLSADDKTGAGGEKKATGRRINRDKFRNYVLLFANYRGGIKREPDRGLCEQNGFDYEDICRVRERLISLVDSISDGGNASKTGEAYIDALTSILDEVNAKDRLVRMSKIYESQRPAESALYGRAYYECMSVLDELRILFRGEGEDLFDFLKVMRSALDAKKVTVERPKNDAVYVGDISWCVNHGTDYLFAAGMTNAVPYAKENTSLLNGGEIGEIEGCARTIAVAETGTLLCPPRFVDTNAKCRETAGLNVCSFAKEIYVSYPVRVEGKEDVVPSEIVSYIRKMFALDSSKPLDMAGACSDREFLSFLCGSSKTALRLLLGSDENVSEAVEGFLRNKPRSAENPGPRVGKKVDHGDLIFASKKEGAVSVTTLEEWFSCPYKAFMEKGLGVVPRKTSADRAMNTGSFVHDVLAAVFNGDRKYGPGDEDEVRQRAAEAFDNLRNDAMIATSDDQKSAENDMKMLKEETMRICLGAFNQLVNSEFDVECAECDVTLDFGEEGRLKGRVDRTDSCRTSGDETLVRVIDYKTGSVPGADKKKYYMGQRLQLELYLDAMAKNKTPVGAYYFPAKTSYVKEGEESDVFPLEGFMKSSYIGASDRTAVTDEKKKSKYIKGATLDKVLETAMEDEVFDDFVMYGVFVAKNGIAEMRSGFIQPTPAAGVCNSCKYSGFCGRMSEIPDRDCATPKSADIAERASKELSEIDDLENLFTVVRCDRSDMEDSEDEDEE